MAQEESFGFKVLIKRDGDLWTAHCLELDIVATAGSRQQAENDLTDLMITQLTYAIENDNLDNLYRSAPADAWREYLDCGNRAEARLSLSKAVGPVIPMLVTSTGLYEEPRHA